MQVLAAEKAGAKAAIIINSENALMPMGMDDENHPTIPSIHIPLAAGKALRDAQASSRGGLLGTLRSMPAQPDSAAAEHGTQQQSQAVSMVIAFCTTGQRSIMLCGNARVLDPQRSCDIRHVTRAFI